MIIIRRLSLSVLALLLTDIPVFSHGSGKIHVREMYSVLPFAVRDNGSPTPENKAVADWLGLITSDLIDNYRGVPCEAFGGKNFYDYLRDGYGFHCKHRLLFHWGYNAKPWSDDLERKVSKYSWYSDADSLKDFRQAFVIEQRRRNAAANAATEEVFGLSEAGRQSAWANGIIAVMYDVHLLGDWVPDDNSDFDGLTSPSAIAGDLVNAFRRIDSTGCKPLEKKLAAIVKNASDEHEMAVMMISVLQEDFPVFLLQCNGGALKRIFLSRGYTFRDYPD